MPEHSSNHGAQPFHQSNEYSADGTGVKTSTFESNASNLAEEALDDSWPFGNNADPQPPKSALPAKAASKKQEASSEGDFLENAIQKIESLFEANPKDFTQKHQAWILGKARKAADKAGVQKMLAYAEKVVRQAA